MLLGTQVQSGHVKCVPLVQHGQQRQRGHEDIDLSLFHGQTAAHLEFPTVAAVTCYIDLLAGAPSRPDQLVQRQPARLGDFARRHLPHVGGTVTHETLGPMPHGQRPHRDLVRPVGRIGREGNPRHPVS